MGGFIKIIDDPEGVNSSWHDWHKAFKKTKKHLIDQGFEVIEIVVDLDELIAYCNMKGIQNNGRARAQFVQNKHS